MESIWQSGVLDPQGPIGAAERLILLNATAIMLAIIIPVIVLALGFAWWFRASNSRAQYLPTFQYSGPIELVVWAIPALVIMFLGGMAWISSHDLDPPRPIVSKVPPIEIQVVALDWKWLFIYPDHGIAVVNELAAPVDTPIHFKITASSVMNSFFVPALAGQIYAMPSMATSLHAVINRTGEYAGFSANYSGAGFSDMRFKFLGMSAADFDRWMQKAKAGGELSRGSYIQLEQPSEREPVRRYGAVAPDLFDAIVNRCVDQGKMCLREMMAMDAHRPSGRQSAREPIALNLGLDAAVCRADNSAAADLLPSVYRD